jgi:hypothetical protein
VLVTSSKNSQQCVAQSATDLVDIARDKPAVQSSLSQWSHSGEARDATSGHFPSEYAFHTEKEDNPWWQIDLMSVYPIEAIVVHNRRPSFQDRACTLRVEIAERNDEWVLIHAGFAHFGSAGNGRPLELSIGSKLEARYVRLSLAEQEYLHLSQIEVLVRPELFALTDFCKQHRLPHFFARRNTTRSRYFLERNKDAVRHQIVGLKINYSGRFGNLLHQYINVIRLAKRTGLKIVQLGSHELLDVKTDFTVDGITFLPSDATLPTDGAFISGEFFNSDDFVPVLEPFLRFRPEDEVEFTSVTQIYIRSHMLTGIPLPDELHPVDELTIHIRSGDIFSSDHPVTYGYRQPPLSFYILVISRMRDSGRINKVRLVFEDRGNPCIDAMETWMEQESIPYRVSSASLHQDMSALIDAPHLVFGHGTFGYAACRLSKRIETVHFFKPELGGRYDYIPVIGEVFAVSDRAGGYIKAYEYGVSFGAKDGWRNTPEMQAMMLTYPIESLTIERLPKNVGSGPA